MYFATIDQAGIADNEKRRLNALESRFEAGWKAAGMKPWAQASLIGKEEQSNS